MTIETQLVRLSSIQTAQCFALSVGGTPCFKTGDTSAVKLETAEALSGLSPDTFVQPLNAKVVILP